MTGRDRIVAIGLAIVAVLAAGWMLIVSPEREQANQLSAQLSAAQTQRSSAEGQLASAHSAQSQYAAAYASVVSLGKAVPVSQEVPSLIYQLAQASNEKNVQFSSIASASASGPSSSASAAGASAAGASAATAAFTQMPFTFIFNGTFFDLEHLFQQLDSFTTRTASGGLLVSGRLLTIQSVKLAPLSEQQGKGATGALTGTITATAYELAGGQSLTGGTSSTSAAGSTAPVASGAAASSPTPPALARVSP